MDQISVPGLVSDRLAQLLQRPGGARMGCHVAMDQSAAPVLNHHEYVQQPKRSRYGDEEITRHDPLCVVSGTSTSASPLGDGPAGASVDTSARCEERPECPSFSTAHWRCAPRPTRDSPSPSVGSSSRNLQRNRRRPGRDFHSPEELPSRSVPTNQGLGTHHDQGVPPFEQSRQQSERNRVAGSIRRAFTPRSLYSASCRRRNKFSASIERDDRSTRPDQRNRVRCKLNQKDENPQHRSMMPRLLSRFEIESIFPLIE